MSSFCCSWLTVLFLMHGGPEALAQATADGSALSRPKTPIIEHMLQELLTLLKRGSEPSSSLTLTSSSLAAAATANVNGDELRRLGGQISELNTALQRITESLRLQAEEQVAQRVTIRDVLQMASRIQQTQQHTATATNVTEQLSAEIREESQKTRLEINVASSYSRDVCINASRIAVENLMSIVSSGQRPQSTIDQDEARLQLLNEIRNSWRQTNSSDRHSNDTDVVLNNLLSGFQRRLRQYTVTLANYANVSDSLRLERLLQTELGVFVNLSSFIRRIDTNCADIRSQMKVLLMRATDSVDEALRQPGGANFWNGMIPFITSMNEVRQSFKGDTQNRFSRFLEDFVRQFQRVSDVVLAAGLSISKFRKHQEPLSSCTIVEMEETRLEIEKSYRSVFGRPNGSWVSCCIGAGSGLSRWRLVNGNSTREGRVEVQFSSEGVGDRWGTVCDDNFDNVDATVVCYSLGYGRIGRTLGNAYGPGSGEILLDDLACTGTESTLLECSHNGLAVHNCGHQEDVAVSCVAP